MIKKKKIMAILALITITTSISYVSAWTGSIGYASTGGSGYGGDYGGEGESEQEYDDTPYEIPLGVENGKTYTCEYNYNVNIDYEITIDGYDLSNESMLENSLEIDEENKIMAGTSIGLHIFETKKISWNVIKIEVTEDGWDTYYTYNCCIASDTGVESCITSNSSCPSGYSVEGYDIRNERYEGRESTDPEKVNECKNEAAKSALAAAEGNINSSYILTLSNSNDKNSDEDIIEIEGVETECESKCEFSPPEGLTSDSITITYVYEPEATCIDVKTGEISYINNSGSCNSEREIEVEKDTVEDKTHWHYFAPINLNSEDEFSFQLKPASGAQLVEEQCLYVINEYPDEYTSLIVKNDNSNLSENPTIAKTEIGEGCQLTSKIIIPIKQGFFKEDSSTAFKGFNFYYKPIDINNPFPNGLPTESLWEEWNESGKNSPNLSQSFSNLTYSTKNLNKQSIKSFDQTTGNSYTADDDSPQFDPNLSWLTITNEGFSRFIDSAGIIERKVNKSSLYKLGCGPFNDSWGGCN